MRGASLDRDQPVEGVVEVEALATAEVVGVLVDADCGVRCDELTGIAARQRRDGRDLGAPGVVEASLVVDRAAALVHGAMVAATEQGEIRERGGAAVRPVTDVMSLSEANTAAREAAAAVAVVERPP